MNQNIPMELRALPQWVVAGPGKVPLNPRTGQLADVTDATTWGSFDEACRSGMRYVGFVLTDGDPYCIIDLDNKPERPLTPEQWALHERILNAFPTYTERSASGRGYHIVMRGRMTGGRRSRRDEVEAYADGRYMIFTGEVVRNAPIIDCQATLDALVAQMPAETSQSELEQNDGLLTDREVHEIAVGAANGEKYNALCAGDWAGLGYPSQSEADFALLSIIAFYTRDNEQVRRLFRYSNLGRRDKATRDNRYLDFALRKIRAKGPTTADLSAAAEAARALMAPAPEPAAPPAPAAPQPAPVQTTAPVAAPEVQPYTPVPSDYTLPPGLVGEMAAYFYSTAVRPVPEVALASAIALLAGMVGRCFNVSGTGLNTYMLLIAKTGTGKEGIAKCIGKLLAAVRPQVPMVDEFMGPGAFASGQGLIRVLDNRPCFVSILGEFGYTLQAMNDPRANAAQVLLKRVLLDLYAKSGWEDTLRSTAYSDTEKNTKTIHAPSVSFLGESVPEAFYDNINGGDISDGLIPRLHIIEYRGERPKRNKQAMHPPTQQLAQRVADMVALSLTMQNNHTCANVAFDAEALRTMDAFDEECDDHMRRALGQAETQLWNRAHLKALKLSALLAVGVNPLAPTVTLELAHWAIEFTKRGTDAVLSRFTSGDVGTGDAKQMAELRRIVSEYFKHDHATLKTYKVDPTLQKAGLIPYSYFVVRVARMASFYKDPRGATRTLRNSLETLVASEVLQAVDTATAVARFGKRQTLYAVGNTW